MRAPYCIIAERRQECGMCRKALIVLVCAAAVACARGESKASRDPDLPGPERRPLAAMPQIDADVLLEHTKVLASDRFEGRAPGTRGEELTVRYLTEQFEKLGLKPGNLDGTYVQRVPLVGIT